jgi:hypothetical protein
MEGIPGRSSAFLSRGAREGGLGDSTVFRPAPTLAPCEDTRPEAAPVKTREAGGSEESRQGYQRLDRTRLRGKKTPTLLHPSEDARVHSTCVVRRSAEAVSGVVKRLVPRSFTLRSQSLRGVSTSRKGRTEPGTREVRVHVIRLDGRYRFVASRVFPVDRSQGRSVVRGR